MPASSVHRVRHSLTYIFSQTSPAIGQRLQLFDVDVSKAIRLSLFAMVLDANEAFGVGRILDVGHFDVVEMDRNVISLASDLVTIPAATL